MRQRYGSALGAFLLLIGCGEEPETNLSVHAHALESCPLRGAELLELNALGDFGVSNDSVALLPLNARDVRLGFPLATLGAEASSQTSDGRFFGVATARAGRIDLVLWPDERACDLFSTGSQPGSDYPAPGGGQALGVSKLAGLALVAGGADDTSQSGALGALSIELATGRTERVAGEMFEARAFASVTPFGAELLVAGGLDPRRSDDNVQNSAEVFDPATRRFDSELIDLKGQARARHGALVLPDGRTLLVGGVGSGGEALRTLMAVSPSTRSASESGLAVLSSGRVGPSVLQLDDGRILVAGGVDQSGAPHDSVQLLASDASLVVGSVGLPKRYNRAFVAMPGGSFLALGGCEERGPLAGEDCAAICGANSGCPPAEYDAYWVTPEGVASRLPALALPAPRPQLVSAADGAPWLVVNQQFLRFNPWTGRFDPPTRRPSAGPDTTQPPPLALDEGAFVWLEAGAGSSKLRGFRHSIRGTLSRDLKLLDVDSALDELTLDRPAHVAPNRLPLSSAGAGVRYERSVGLRLIENFAKVYVTDALYGDFSARIKLSSGPPPVVLLGADEVGSSLCPWPPGGNAPAGGETLMLFRTGGTVQLQRGSELAVCNVSNERVLLGLKAGAADRETVLRSLDIQRGTPDVF